MISTVFAQLPVEHGLYLDRENGTD